MNIPNQTGGVQYTAPNDKITAQRADLITLPPNMPGTNCANCIFFNPQTGFCRHPAVKLTVTGRMCCKFWKNQGQTNSWE